MGQGVKRPVATDQWRGRKEACCSGLHRPSVLELPRLHTPAFQGLPPVPGWGKSAYKLMKGFTQHYEGLVLGQQHL